MRIRQTIDYETIAKLNKNVQDVHAELFPSYFMPYEYEPVRDFYKSIVEQPNQIFLLVEENENAIGYVWMTVRDSPDTPFKKASKSLYIHQISVDSNSSNKGVGSKLIIHIEKMAKEMGATKLELDYWIDNTIARNFYKKLGFVVNREVVQKMIN
jgi:ribosomal protein S18 acetylase RimI-like enzyme